MSLSFGVHIPTCIEGMMYPIPFARPSDILPTALLCERLGYDSVWGNDHMSTQRYVQREFPHPPNFYEPLITFTYVAARTTRLRLCTASWCSRCATWSSRPSRWRPWTSSRGGG